MDRIKPSCKFETPLQIPADSLKTLSQFLDILTCTPTQTVKSIFRRQFGVSFLSVEAKQMKFPRFCKTNPDRFGAVNIRIDISLLRTSYRFALSKRLPFIKNNQESKYSCYLNKTLEPYPRSPSSPLISSKHKKALDEML